MKQVKITIILDQALQGEHTEAVTRAILGDPMAYGRYTSFSQDRVKVEEFDTDDDPKAFVKAETLYPCRALSDKLDAGIELTPAENARMFKNMDKQMAFFGGVRWGRSNGKAIDPAPGTLEDDDTEEGILVNVIYDCDWCDMTEASISKTVKYLQENYNITRKIKVQS